MSHFRPWLMLVLLVGIPGIGHAAEQVESPIYLSWAKYKPGTEISVRSTTVQLGKTIETVSKSRLVSVDANKVVIETVFTSNGTGATVENPPQTFEYKRWFLLLPGVRKEDIGRPEGKKENQGEETLNLADRAFKTVWFQIRSTTEAGEAITKVWMCDEVPGKLVKSVTKVPVADKITTLELVELKMR